MCGIYSHTDPALYASRTRSLRLHGVVTTLRLESIFWDILGRIAKESNMTLNQAITHLVDEAIERHGTLRNTASFLRVCCMRYMDVGLPVEVETPAERPVARSRSIAEEENMVASVAPA